MDFFSQKYVISLTARKNQGIMQGMNTEEIKARMKQARISRQEIADKLGVSKGTVNNWLCEATPIPHAKQQLIEQMLAPQQSAPQSNELDLFSTKIILVRLTAQELDMCIRAARACGMELEDWARDTTLKAARSMTAKQEASTASKGGKPH